MTLQVHAGPGVAGFYSGSGGDVSLHLEDGSDVLFAAVPAGQIIPVRFLRVNRTSHDATTATNLVALF